MNDEAGFLITIGIILLIGLSVDALGKKTKLPRATLLIGRNKIAVPKAFWKMLFNKEKNYERCFYYENIIGLKTKGDKLRDHEVECKSLF